MGEPLNPSTRDPERDAPVVLLVDGDHRLRRVLGRVLELQGYRVLEAGQDQVAMELAGRETIDVALVDVQSGADSTGVELIRKLKEQSPELQCIVLTGQGSAAHAFGSLDAGAYDYFEKPISDWTRFGQVVRKAIEMRRLQSERERLANFKGLLASRLSRDFADPIVGRSLVMSKLAEILQRIAKVRVPVLIMGESGSGKELVARALHSRSPWSDRPFVDLNCAAIPPNLLESELFGHERGAFTGAVQRKLGLFEVAEDGAIFLDEIGEMPVDLQARLLRVIQEGQFRRVGGTKTLPNRARIISATNRDLKAAIREGRFREDLFYRLNVFDIRVPPLRERKEDIPLLVWYFVKHFNETYGKTVRSVPDDVMRHLTEQDWHENNVRQLEHSIHRAMVLAEGDSLELEHFEHRQRSSFEIGNADAPQVEISKNLCRLPYKDAKSQVVDSFSRAYLVQQLQETGGNVTRAAQLSGLERPNFRKLLKKYRVQTVHQARHGVDPNDPDDAEDLSGEED